MRKRWKQLNEKYPVPKLVEKQVKGQRKIKPLNSPPNWFAEKLENHQCLVMLDGLDEVADETERKRVSRWVDEQMQAYPDTPFILTSRPFGYESAQLQQAAITLEVKPFNLKQMKQFLQSWYLQIEIMSRAGEDDLGVREEAIQQADDLIERILNSKPLCDMAVNPLLLTMIATVHRRGSALPGKRVELYKEICHVLLEKRQRAKFRNSEDLNDPLTAAQKQSVLQVLALRLMQSKVREFQISQAASLIREQLSLVAGGSVTSGKFLEKIKDVSGLLIEKEIGIYEFAHLSFQEYLAAVQIEALNQEKLLIQNIRNPWWAETIRLYVANNDATQIIGAAMNKSKRTIFTLTLAYDCLDEKLSINPKLQEKMEEWYEEALESSDPKIARVAASVQLKRRLR
ncbi:MAG: hypothetical protein SW833_06690 [Cyanobacteriota bacterium]|nr:hypothetical protein [Cyanobacteriota bacterium]